MSTTKLQFASPMLFNFCEEVHVAQVKLIKVAQLIIRSAQSQKLQLHLKSNISIMSQHHVFVSQRFLNVIINTLPSSV